MDRYKVVKEDVLNAYIVDIEENYIVALCGTKRPDLGFDRLEKLVEQANEYIKISQVGEMAVELIKDSEKLEALNSIEIYEFSCCGGECEYVLAEDNPQNRKILRNIGLTDKDIEEYTDDGYIDISMIAWDYTEANYWNDKLGFMRGEHE